MKRDSISGDSPSPTPAAFTDSLLVTTPEVNDIITIILRSSESDQDESEDNHTWFHHGTLVEDGDDPRPTPTTSMTSWNALSGVFYHTTTGDLMYAPFLPNPDILHDPALSFIPEPVTVMVSTGGLVCSRSRKKCALLEDARKLFDGMSERDLVSWNAMICGYNANAHYEEAIRMVARMREGGLKPNAVTLVSMISACGEMSQLRMGKEVHCYCVRNEFFNWEPYEGTSLIGFYSRLDAGYSRSVFELMMVRNAVSWNAVIYACYHKGDVDEALRLFVRMIGGDVTPDSVTFLAIIQSCGEFGNMELEKQVHQLVIKHGYSSDDFVGTAVVDMHGKCGWSESAYKEKMYVKDIASWNAMLSVYKNYNVYSTIEPALLSMYSDCDSMTLVLTIFNEMDNPDAVTWNTFIEGLIRNGMACQAFGHFRHMQQSGTVPNSSEVKPNSSTMVSVLLSCAKMGNLPQGRCLHAYIVRREIGLASHISLGNDLLTMYARCGSLVNAERVFRRRVGFMERHILRSPVGAALGRAPLSTRRAPTSSGPQPSLPHRPLSTISRTRRWRLPTKRS